MTDIIQFKDEYRWLSNFAPCTIVLHGRNYPSVEHAYMSAKCDDEEWKLFCQNTASAGEVKKASRDVQLVSDWDSKKVGVMLVCIRQKYSQEPYRSQLVATKNRYIQEGNFWGDKFWGVCLKTGEGENHLGEMIMDKRQWLKRVYGNNEYD